MSLKITLKKLICYVAIITISILPLQGFADSDEATSSANGTSLTPYLLAGVGLAAAGGLVFALAGHGGGSGNNHSGPNPGPSPQPSPTGPVCDQACISNIFTAVINYKNTHQIPNMHIVFKAPLSFLSFHSNSEAYTNEDEGHRFLSGSFTRLIATAVMLKQGIDLNKTIGEMHLDSSYPAWNNITIRQLLNMTSGIPNYQSTTKYWETLFSDPNHYWQKSNDLVGLVNPTATNFPAGTNWENSNTNDALLEMIFDKATASPTSTMEKQIQSLISLLGVGLSDTIYDTGIPYQQLINMISTNHYRGNDPLHQNFNFQTLSPSALRTSGGMITSVDDAASSLWLLWHTALVSSWISDITNNMVCTGLKSYDCQLGAIVPTNSSDVAYNGGLYRFGLNQLNYTNTDRVYFIDGSTPGSTMVAYYYRNDAKNLDFVIAIAGNVGSNQNFPAYSDLYVQILNIILK